MPPIRTVSTTKPQRTERTHEENQERAYIAASRRSDRSLEARIESARRASEIHKKRTGRALRVTEQDVVNEEMYEEEDEDLPAQIRRLQHFAHLQTNSDNFNYRLHNYMASHIGTRQALMNQQAQFANAPFFSNQFAPPQPTTMLPPQMLHYNQGLQHGGGGGGGMDPSSNQGGFDTGMHHRSASFSMHPGMKFQQSNPGSPMGAQAFDRRLSMPAQVSQSSASSSQPQTPTTPSVQQSMPSHIKQEPDANKVNLHFSQAQDSPSIGGMSGMDFNAVNATTANHSLAPFSASLPAETQQLLALPTSIGGGGASDGMYNPYNLFPGMTVPMPSYPYKPSMMSGSLAVTTSAPDHQSGGLAMHQLDTTSLSSPSSASGGYVTSANSDFGYFGSDALFGDSNLKLGTGLSRPSSGSGGGTDHDNVTPGGTDWQNFIDNTSFDDAAAAVTSGAGEAGSATG